MFVSKAKSSTKEYWDIKNTWKVQNLKIIVATENSTEWSKEYKNWWWIEIKIVDNNLNVEGN